jgi:hypothetical protein
VTDGASASIDAARAARRSAAADRETRREILDEARATRRRARVLRDAAAVARERALEYRWSFWTCGYVPEPPSFVPVAWEHEAALRRPIADARQACTACARAARKTLAARANAEPVLARQLPLVVAACETAAAHADAESPSLAAVLSICVRTLDVLAAEVEAEANPPDVAALAAACREAVRCARVALATLRVDA